MVSYSTGCPSQLLTGKCVPTNQFSISLFFNGFVLDTTSAFYPAQRTNLEVVEKNLRLAESVSAAVFSLRKADGYSRGISLSGMRSDLLALPTIRLDGGSKLPLSVIH
jgi:hypothetical protein